jgi:hypothetical protein
MTCPHSVSQNGTWGRADGPDKKGRWHLEQVTNSQISGSFGDEEETWDMLGVASKVHEKRGRLHRGPDKPFFGL